MTATVSQLQVREAVLFVSSMKGQADEHRRVLATTLVRLGVQCDSQRTVVLLKEPLLGRQYQVRVTPCLVLDTGSRRVQLPGDPAVLNAAALEGALGRP